jgi:hypothetical protein
MASLWFCYLTINENMRPQFIDLLLRILLIVKLVIYCDYNHRCTILYNGPEVKSEGAESPLENASVSDAAEKWAAGLIMASETSMRLS